MSSTMTSAGKYLYAIIPEGVDLKFGEIGIDGGKVYLITDDHVSAVVSDFKNGKIRPERRHLAAHQAVLKSIMKEESPLPISFGMIAGSTEEIRRILSLNWKSFADQLKRVHGKVEMGVRVVWDVPNIFEYFVNIHKELRETRDKLFGGSRNPTQDDKIEVGRLFEWLLKDDRENLTQRVEEGLESTCFEITRLPPRNEKDVMNLACLVARERVEKDFEAAICEIAQNFDNNFTFDFNGPWAPHNFVNVQLVL
jgi:hypothetical protein